MAAGREKREENIGRKGKGDWGVGELRSFEREETLKIGGELLRMAEES